MSDRARVALRKGGMRLLQHGSVNWSLYWLSNQDTETQSPCHVVMLQGTPTEHFSSEFHLKFRRTVACFEMLQKSKRATADSANIYERDATGRNQPPQQCVEAKWMPVSNDPTTGKSSTAQSTGLTCAKGSRADRWDTARRRPGPACPCTNPRARSARPD